MSEKLFFVIFLKETCSVAIKDTYGIRSKQHNHSVVIILLTQSVSMVLKVSQGWKDYNVYKPEESLLWLPIENGCEDTLSGQSYHSVTQNWWLN